MDRRTVAAPIGIDGPDDSKEIDRSELIDQDVHHNADQTDLPVEGPQLTATEVVEEMPQFPGGYTAMVKISRREHRLLRRSATIEARRCVRSVLRGATRRQYHRH